MLKLRRVGITDINPFPVWPPFVSAESDPELKALLATPSADIRLELEGLRGDRERHAHRVMLPLGALYAHYYGYRDAPDISGVEDGHAQVMRVKRILEDEMIARIFAFSPPDTAHFDDDQDKVADYFTALSLDNPGVKHPFFDYVEHEMTMEEMREFLWLEVIRNEVVDDEVAMLVPGLQHSMKQVVASNLWDECGNGRIDNFHTTWLVRLLSHDDQWAEFMEYRETRPWFTMCTSHSFNALLSTPGRGLAAYGTFLINESWVADHFLQILKGMDRLGIEDQDRRIYFDAHYKIDQHHRLEMIEGLRQQYPPLEQPQLREVILGAHQAITAGERMYDALLDYFKAGGRHAKSDAPGLKVVS